MNAFLRPTLRTSFLRNASIPLRCRPAPTPLPRPMAMFRPVTIKLMSTNVRFPLKPATPQGQIRSVASQVSGRPGSQSLEHAATNVKEELGNSASDLAKVIAGANMTKDAIVDHSGESFYGITSKVAHEVPAHLMVLGLSGGIPYIAASGTTLWLAKQAQIAASGAAVKLDPGVALTMLDQALNFQVAYGAVMLAALGALQWGFEMSAYGGHKGYVRLGIGLAPMLIAWTSLGMQPMEALVLQWFAFTALWYADSKTTMAGWAPKWYSQYRFYLSILVGTCIIASLAGTSYWGPVAGHGFLSHELDELRERRRQNMPQKHGLIMGPIEAVPAGADSDRFTRVHDRSKD